MSVTFGPVDLSIGESLGKLRRRPRIVNWPPMGLALK